MFRNLIFAALFVSCVAAAADARDWLDTPEAISFRERVVQLALLYGESSGIDPQGYKIEARELRKIDGKCSEVEVLVIQDTSPLRREQATACKH